MPSQRLLLQTLLRPAARTALRWYYRSISVANGDRIPGEGPVFLALNHPNALIDALVIGSILPRQVRFLAKATLFANPVLARFLRAGGVIPLRRASDEAKLAGNANAVPDASRNVEAFAAVARALADGEAVVIFPEGRSHDEPQLAPLRTGLARMALQARDEHRVRGIFIVPVGLLFERKEAPRSRVLVQVGDPIHVDAFADGPNAVNNLTETVRERLHQVTLNFETAEDAARIRRVGETLATLLAPRGTIDAATPTLRDILSIIRRSDRARRALVDRSDQALFARAEALDARLANFRAQLQHHAIHAEDIALDLGMGAGLRFTLREAVRALVTVPLALWGRVTHFIPIRIARFLATRSVHDRDQPAMRTLVIGLVLVLLTYALQTVLAAMLFGWKWALVILLSFVPSASSDFRFGDRYERLRARARAFWLFRRQPELQRELVAEADWLRHEAGALERAAHGA